MRLAAIALSLACALLVGHALRLRGELATARAEASSLRAAGARTDLTLGVCVATLEAARDAVLAAESQAEAAYWRTVEAQELAEIRCRRPLRNAVRVAAIK